ncbi:MAG: ATP-binding protein [Bacilli bacterium]
MFKEIIKISDEFIKIKFDESRNTNLLNKFVKFIDDKSFLIGQVSNLDGNAIDVSIIGEIKESRFSYGTLKNPAYNAKIKLLSDEEVTVLIKGNYTDKNLYLGKSLTYENVNVTVSADNFFNGHLAIFGTTGHGKSSCVSKILQNLLYDKKNIAYNANIFIFDVYDEYRQTFKDINNINPYINFKSYTTNLNEKRTKNNKLLQIPAWFLDVDDLALLLNVNDINQLPILEKTLKYVTIFSKDDDKSESFKTSILAQVVSDILMSGKATIQIRDQIISILSEYNTSILNLDTKIVQPGLVRTIRQCINIDNAGKFLEVKELVSFLELQKYQNFELKLPKGELFYTLNDIKVALDFVLLSEGIFNNAVVYEKYNELKVRLNNIINSDISEFFTYDNYISIDNYIKNLLITEDGHKTQLIHFNINDIDDRFANTVVKIYSKLLFNFSTGLKNRASLAFHMFVEEAHRYVKQDNDINILGYNIFERIAKEGRKYGVILGLISQRPSELSETVLSQCTNFLVFKLLHPKDLNFIESVIPNINIKDIKNIKSLPAGTCFMLGNLTKIPIFVKFELPKPSPKSCSTDISKIWYLDK